MGILSWFGRRHSKESTRTEPTVTLPPSDHRKRALRPIGCPDVAPPSPYIRESARAREAEAVAQGAIAAVWQSSSFYDRYGGSDHPERNQRIYLIRGSWAHRKGFLQPSTDGYTDEVTSPAEELGCECRYDYVFVLGRIPEEMLTPEGAKVLKNARAKIAELQRQIREEQHK